MQPQEMTKEPMVELDTGGNAVDVELKQEKEVQVEEQKEDKVESKETKKENKKDENYFYSIFFNVSVKRSKSVELFHK